MSRNSIRFRLTIWYSLALAAGLLLFAIATWASMHHILLSDAKDSLHDRLEGARAFLRAELAEPKVNLSEELGEYSHGFPPDSYLEVTDASGRIAFSSNPDFPWHVRVPAQSSTAVWRGQSYLMLSDQESIDGRVWQFIISAPVKESECLLGRLELLLITLIPVVIVVASLGGRWLSGRALKPVDEMTAAARSISAANLSERLFVPPTGDELERLAETWNSMLSRLEVTLKTLSSFTADASHELRTPVAVIRTTAELALRKARSPESYRVALEQIENESERLTRLLEDLLLLARVDSDSVQLPKSPFNLNPVVDDLCSQMSPLAEAKGLRLKFQTSPDNATVFGNGDSIRRLVLVLIDNAVKYSRTGTDVTIALEKKAETVCLEVSDHGPGIGEDELPLIFERFYRGPQSRQREEGAGLGLSLAAGIAQKNNASIEVTSALGKGSSFRVLFPAA